jgi:hypothetical protein
MDIFELWSAALADAGIDEHDALLFPVSGAMSATGEHGKTWLRNTQISDQDDCVALADRIVEANGESGRSKRRVAVWTDHSEEGIAATLRHELEHTVQHEGQGRVLQRLYDEAFDVLCRIAGGVPGSNQLYNMIPMEQDANAAAAVFVRSLFGDARIDALVASGDKHSAMFRSRNELQPGASMRERMERFVRTDGPRIATEFVRADPGSSRQR